MTEPGAFLISRRPTGAGGVIIVRATQPSYVPNKGLGVIGLMGKERLLPFLRFTPLHAPKSTIFYKPSIISMIRMVNTFDKPQNV
jgi:hypothetical protein